MKFLKFTILLAFIVVVASCGREEAVLGNNHNISISRDTIRFDTVFTSIGSATRSFKVFNHEPNPINLEAISLGSRSSFFRFNADGLKGPVANNLIVEGGDSIHVFVEVTIDPALPLSNSPFIIEDRIDIENGEKDISLILEAWGQNANYFPSRNDDGNINLLSCNFNEIVWNDDKPYVIYGVLAIDSCSLILPEGCQVYVHGGVVSNEELVYNDGLLLFLKDGNLESRGTVDNPVIIQGDRLEPEFQNVEGLWSGIRFLSESSGNSISHTKIKNAIVGLRVDSLAELTLESSEIYNCAGNGLLGINGKINMSNTLVHSSNGSAVQLIQGGEYNLYYNTISSFKSSSPACIITNYLCTDPQCIEEVITLPLNLEMINSIITGTNDEDLIIDDIAEGGDPNLYDAILSNNLIRSLDTTENVWLRNCIDCCYSNLTDILFLNPFNNEFQLDTNSIAEGKAVPLERIIFDIIGNRRDAVAPDAGCYEYLE